MAGFYRFNSQGLSRLANTPAVVRYLRANHPETSLNWPASRWLACYPGIGIALNRIHKNANSSAVVLLNDLETGSIDHQRTVKKGAPTLFDFGWRQRDFPPKLAYMVIIRNPYSRVLSAFLDKHKSRKIRERHGVWEPTPEGFAAFLGYLEAGGLGGNSHWDLQKKQMLLPLSAYDGVIRFENLREEMLGFLATRGLHPRPGSLEELYPSDRGKKTDATAKLEAFYTRDSRDRVARLFAEDFDALGYDTAFPGTLGS